MAEIGTKTGFFNVEALDWFFFNIIALQDGPFERNGPLGHSYLNVMALRVSSLII
jgi:hypothetical protein